ncbi:MAG: PEGA domain-containing protein [Vicinamibacterales bacterium]
MNLAPSPVDRPEAPLFSDGLGERVVAADATTGELLQILRLRPSLTAVPSFEFALRERAARLMNFRHAYYARVRRVDRVQVNGSTLAVVSDHVEGTRLSDILRVAHQRGLQLDTNAALCLIRQLVPAAALLHENARDASHGLIAPERIIVTPHARLVIVEHVAGSAIEQLQLSRERLWQEFRVAMPSSAGMSRFDHRADVNGIGITALSLILGRPLAADEFPHAVPDLLIQARERSPLGDERPLSNAFRNWLGRTLQLDVRRAFASAPEALAALEETLATDPSYVPAPVALETFLSQYIAAILELPPPAPTLSTPPPAIVVPGASTVASAQPAPVAPLLPVVEVPLAGPIVSRAQAFTARAPSADLVPRDSAAEHHDSLPAVPTIAELIQVDDLQPASQSTRPPQVDCHEPSRSMRDEPYDALSAFGPDGGVERADTGHAVGPRRDKPGPPRRSRTKPIATVVAALAIMSGGVFATRMYNGTPAPSLGTLVVQSSPAGVEVFVDGVSRGMTPSRLSLPAGSHILELRGRGVPRVIPLVVPAGGQISQYLEFADTPVTGMLVVHSQPAGANVTVDGVARGVAPITLEGLEPGDHEVILQKDTATSRHVVKVLAGTTASLVAPVAGTVSAAEGPVSGWISVKAPFTIEIREDGQLLGTTQLDRLMMAAGRHQLEFVNQALGYRESRTVQVLPGKVATMTIELPSGTVNLNAAPWAEVWIDGRRVGETPIGNLEVPIGPHEVVFRHPEFGEKRHAISVTAVAPVRLSVSMR